MKQQDFDNLMRDKLNQQDYSFNQSNWDAFENKLNKSQSSFSSLKWWLGGSAALIGGFVLISIFTNDTYQSNENSPSTTVKNDVSPKTNEILISASSEENNLDSINLSSQIEDTGDQDPNPIAVNSNQTNDLANTTSIEKTSIDKVTKPLENTNTASSVSNEKSTSSQLNDASSQKGSSNITVPSALILVGKNEICLGESIEFETIEQENVVYSWNFGDNQYSNLRAPSHVYKQAGSFPVTLIVTSTKDHSIISKSKEILVEVIELPDADFTYEMMQETSVSTIMLKPKNQDINPNWDFGDGYKSNELNPSHQYPKKGYYNITLETKNHFGCSAKTTKKVTIQEDYNLLAPNSFTPNGDGINDFFIPEALKTMDVQFTMTIYSQTEGLIFESKNINQQWNGINQQNGNVCGEATYIWIVNLINSDGKAEQYKGAVLLLRQ